MNVLIGSSRVRPEPSIAPQGSPPRAMAAI
jgi:hypothetical protein